MDVSDDRRVPHQIRQQGDEGQQHHVCRRCGWPFPNPHPSAKHRRAHKKNCGKIEGYIILDASGKINGTDEANGDHSSDRIDEQTVMVDSDLAKGKAISCYESSYKDSDVVNILQSEDVMASDSSSNDAVAVINHTEDTSNSGYLLEVTPVQDHDVAVGVPLCKEIFEDDQRKSHNFSSQDEVNDENTKTDNVMPVLHEQHSDPTFDSSTEELQAEKMNSGIEIRSNRFENAIGNHEVLRGGGEIDLSHAGQETTEKACFDEGAIIMNSTEIFQTITESAQSEQSLEDEKMKCTIRCSNSLDFSQGKDRFFEDHGSPSSLSPVNSEEQANISFITLELEKNDEPRHDTENEIATKKLPDDEFLDCRGNFEHSLMDDVVSESSLPDRMKANEVDISAFSFPEADLYLLDATPTESETPEFMPENGTSTGHIDDYAVENDIVAEPRILAEASQIAPHEDIKTHGNNTDWNTINENRETIHAADELNPTYNSTDSANTNIATYPETLSNKSVPDEVLDNKCVQERFKAHIVDFDTKSPSSGLEFVDEIIPGETESSNKPVTKSNICIVENEAESAAVSPDETPDTIPTIQKDEEKECFLGRLEIIHDDSKSILTTEETTTGVSEQSLINEEFLAKDQRLDAAVDSSRQSDGVGGQWGSMSDASHGFASNGSNEEPSDEQGEPKIEEVSDEIQVSSIPREEAKVKKRDEEIFAKEVNWNSEKSHTPLRNLLVQATLESKNKVGNSPTLHGATTTTNAQNVRASTGSPARKIGREEWDSPARLPVRKNDKRFKAKSSWVPFICCPSLD